MGASIVSYDSATGQYYRLDKCGSLVRMMFRDLKGIAMSWDQGRSTALTDEMMLVIRAGLGFFAVP